ncbi:MAG: hypothetical protein ACRERC_00120 [Candidatus Binatia bacterium]
MAANRTLWIIGVCVAAFLVAVVGLGAPVLSALLGTGGAGLLLYYRSRRS